MSAPRSDFLQRLQSRGFIHQCTDLAALDDAAMGGVVTAYVGYDCTAKSLHIGSLISIMMLRHMQQSGHKPIVLMGAGTTRIGDPSGKDESRKLLSDADINANMDGIKTVFAKYLKFGDGPTDAVMVNNADWLDKLEYIPFLRDVGRHFTINRMLSFDSVKTRLEREQPLTFLEFNYMILQAYDFLELNRRKNCALQMGGSDQWGNIVNGVELIRRIDEKPAFGLTCPLLTTSSGAKMGKTANGAVWLNADMFSPYDFWQYWRNTEDADVGKFLRLFTELPLNEIGRLEALQGDELKEAKKVLADKATELCHGTIAFTAVSATSAAVFGGPSIFTTIVSAPGAQSELERLGNTVFATTTVASGQVEYRITSLPVFNVPRQDLANGILAYTLLVETALASSNGEGRKLIRNGGVRVNDVAIVDEKHLVGEKDLMDGVVKLSAGKKRHVLVRPA